jgi:hypothetical protein
LCNTRGGDARAFPQGIAPARTFARWWFGRTRLWRVRPLGVSTPGSLSGLGLYLADGLLESKPLARNFSLAQRRLNSAKLSDQGRAGALIQCPAALAGGIGVEAGYGSRDEGIIISHSCSAGEPFTQLSF